jgi:hypothetical protein
MPALFRLREGGSGGGAANSTVGPTVGPPQADDVFDAGCGEHKFVGVRLAARRAVYGG